jgi:hypothetical protein
MNFSRLKEYESSETDLLIEVVAELQSDFYLHQDGYVFLHLEKVDNTKSKFCKFIVVPYVEHPDEHDWHQMLNRPTVAVVFNDEYYEVICCGHAISARVRVYKYNSEIGLISRNSDFNSDALIDPLTIRLQSLMKAFNSAKRRAVA